MKYLNLDQDNTLGGNAPSPNKISSQKALKEYIDSHGGGGSSTDVQINSTSITSGGVANILTESAYDASSNKIATVSDLPTVGNGTIVINQGGVKKGEFTTNQSGNTTVNLDAGGSSASFITVESDTGGEVVVDAGDRTITDTQGNVVINGSDDIISFSTVALTGDYYDLNNLPDLNKKQNLLMAGPNINIEPSVKIADIPFGYAQLYYLEANGAQFIDTDWTYDSTKTVTIDCKFTVSNYQGGSGGYPVVYGLQTASYTNWIYPFYINNSYFNPYIGGSAGIDSVPCTLDKIYDTSFTIGNGTWSRTINGSLSSGTWSGTIDSSDSLFLFAGSYGSNVINQLFGKIYGFKITEDDTVVLHYIPCQRISDSVGGMYDLITNTFHPSTNGINFACGPVVDNEKDIISVDLETSYIIGKIGYTPEDVSNKVTSISSSSTDTQYPSAKCVYDQLALKQNTLGYTAENVSNKVTSISSSSTDTQYPSAKCVYDAIQSGGGGGVFIATYGTTSYTDILNAYNAGKEIICHYTSGTNIYELRINYKSSSYFYFSSVLNASYQYYRATLSSSSSWSISTYTALHSVSYNSSTQALTIS